ncbi:MAG: hypothetical protein NC548_44910 [Lachnospiraceae bacterium]|nr:hypothetical protein [Lachnospiraceae bacterium]MCM1232197.1 hypothetical protein [Ruminococcus flavefaciens]
MQSILALDPGESTGWCFLDRENNMQAGTAPKSHISVAKLLDELDPDVVIYETFKLYPSKAQSLIWNSFYPCEVIGVIEYKCAFKGMLSGTSGEHYRPKLVKQAPAVKRYAGTLPKKFAALSKETKLTEHSKDACQHLCYYLRQTGAIDRVMK